MTLMELVVATAILAILASAVLPLSQTAVRRSRELELRRNLRIIRLAIDDYKTDFDRAVVEKKIMPSLTETGYPKSLEELVGGRIGKVSIPISVNICGGSPKILLTNTGKAGVCVLIAKTPNRPFTAARMFMTFIHKALKRPWTELFTKSGRHKTAGFSLIELMIVMSILAILAAIANPSYQRHLIKAHEAVLAEDLYQMRQAIDRFFADHLRYPDNLSELVTAKYLRNLPKAPFTKSDQSWKLIAPETDQGEEPQRGSVFDVTSGSDLIGLNGMPYGDW